MASSSQRPPAVAGSFYPADPGHLCAEVDRYLAAAGPSLRGTVKAIVAPHAGYAYSGPTAGVAFAALAARAATIRRVILLGPSHFVPLRGVALPSVDSFRTPLGEVPLDREAVALLADLAGVSIDDAPHAREHALEVELPFLQRTLGQFELVPMVVGEADPEELAALLGHLWGGEETAIVVSTDLSHYLRYEVARQRDGATAEAIVGLDAARIGDADACGRHPLRGFLHAARARQLTGRLLDLRNSGDTAGSRDQVVGYGAFAFG